MDVVTGRISRQSPRKDLLIGNKKLMRLILQKNNNLLMISDLKDKIFLIENTYDRTNIITWVCIIFLLMWNNNNNGENVSNLS